MDKFVLTSGMFWSLLFILPLVCLLLMIMSHGTQLIVTVYVSPLNNSSHACRDDHEGRLAPV